MKNNKTDEFYDIALSFAGEDRKYVEEVANLLRSRKVNVFYDQFKKVDLWGKDLYQYLSEIYQNKAVYTVIFISKHYKSKRWANHELKSAQARALEENEEYILPVRFDETEVPGIRKTTGYVDLNSTTPEELTSMICQKLDNIAKYFTDLRYIDDISSLYEFSLNKLLAIIGWCYRNRKYQEVIKLIKKIDFYLQKKMQWTKRKKYLYMALEAANNLGQKSLIVEFKGNITTIAMHQGDFDESFKLCKEIVDIAEKHHDNNELFYAYHAIGRVYEAKEDYEKAKDFYKKALNISRNFLSQRSSSNTIHELAVVMYRMGEYKKAEELYKEAIEIANMTGFDFIKACSLHGLGLLYQYKSSGMQNIEMAEDYYNKSLEIKKKLDDQEEIARTEYQLADLYYESGKYKDALNLIKHCVEVFEKTESRYLGQARALMLQISEKCG
ncbi:MAG: tetratricopeptide repeat protein [bacterium]